MMDLQGAATIAGFMFNGGLLIMVLRMQNARTKEKVDMDYCLQQHKRVDEAICRNDKKYEYLMGELKTLSESLNMATNLFARLDERLKLILKDHKGDDI